MKLFGDFGATDSFELIPAVRTPTGSCVDEDGCTWEAVTLCAFAQLKDTKTKVSFLACMDEKDGSPTSAGKSCSAAASIDYTAVETCVSGSESKKLLADASKSFNDKCPGRTTIPHTFVNDADVQPSYSSLSKALCAAGSTAPVCKQSEAASKSCIV